jgi:hypothetical protein
MALERRAFLIEWDEFMDIAEESRGLGVFYKRPSELVIKAAVGRFATEITCKDDKEFEENSRIKFKS